VTLSRSGRTTHGESFTTDSSQNDLLRLRSNTPVLGDPTTTSQTLTLQFSVDVHDLALTIYDLDQDSTSGLLSNRYADNIHISSPRPTRSTPGELILGTGIATDPFRMDPAGGNGNLPGAPRDPLPARDYYKVDLFWDAVPANTPINLVYSQAIWNASPTPTIWISNPTFCA